MYLQCVGHAILHAEPPKLSSDLPNRTQLLAWWIGFGMDDLPLLGGGHGVLSLGYFTSILLVGLLKVGVSSMGISVLCV